MGSTDLDSGRFVLVQSKLYILVSIQVAEVKRFPRHFSKNEQDQLCKVIVKKQWDGLRAVVWCLNCSVTVTIAKVSRHYIELFFAYLCVISYLRS